ncbi:MAG: hypothetical protein AB8B63_24500 [Granulosicoccus sp.]
MIDLQAIERFKKDGVVCLRGLFSSDWLEQLAMRVEHNFDDPGPYNTVYTDPNNPGGFYALQCGIICFPDNNFTKLNA